MGSPFARLVRFGVHSAALVLVASAITHGLEPGQHDLSPMFHIPTR